MPDADNVFNNGYTAAEFSKLLILSIIKDAYYKPSRDGKCLIKQGSGVSVVFVKLIAGSDDTVNVIDTMLSAFKDKAMNDPERHRIANNFVFILDGSLSYVAGLDELLRNKQLELDNVGIISDISVFNIQRGMYYTATGRRCSDRDLSGVFNKAATYLNMSPDERENKSKEEMLAYRKIRSDMKSVEPSGRVNPITLLLVLNIAIFAVGYVMKLINGTDYFVLFGIQNNDLIRQGELWRLVTPMFLHADIAHITGNMIFLYFLGQTLRKYYTDLQFWIIYLVSGLVGNILSFLLTDYQSLGASGAIMGLGGVLIYRVFFGATAKNFRRAGNYTSLAVMVAYNLVYGLIAAENINNYGHFGGFAAGFAIAYLISKIKENSIAEKSSS